MRFFYDTEFLEDGKTIALISIGIVGEDGSEYYAVNLDAPWKRIREHEWLTANVVPSLPLLHGDARNYTRDIINYQHPDMRTYAKIRADVKSFLLGPYAEPRDVELWAWYGAYDHVALAQMWGPMISLPRGIPMWTNDLRQEVERLGLDAETLAPRKDGHHNAIADARWNRDLHAAITAEATS